MSETFFGACPHDCPDNCSMLYTVDKGKLLQVRGNPEHPFTRGRLCVKVKDYERHHYNPERVLYPLRRTGAKGSGKFERISWDEALDEITTRWRSIIENHGAKAILPYGYAGNMGLLNGMNAGDAFFNRLGSSIGEKTFCASSAVTSQFMTIGASLGTDPESMVHASYIIIWGANTLSTNSHLWPFVLQARKNGAKLVVIDPWRSRTAAQADWHIAPRPGTDGALALALINTLVEEKRIDEEYVENYTLGFEELRQNAAEFTLERASEITGIEADHIMRLAVEYTDAKTSVIRVGVGLERYPGGGQAMRAIDCLPALTGAWRHVGGGLLQMPIFVPVRMDVLSHPEWIQPEPRVINLADIARTLNPATKLDIPINSLFIWNANPLTQAPNTEGVRQGLLREDLFTVVSEQFMTDTAQYADIILPATMQAEHNDILTSWGHFYIQFNQKSIDAPGETISNFELFQRLAARFGFDDARFTQSDMEILAESLDWTSPMLQHTSFAELQQHGFVRVNVPDKDHYAPHREGGFPTPSGKCEFRSELGADTGFVGSVLRQMLESDFDSQPIAPVPCYIPNRIKDTENYPLQLISPKSHGFLNSEYANEKHKLRNQGEQFVLLHPVDAEARSISHGDKVRVFNAVGEFQAEALVSEDVLPGNALTTFGYWASRNPLGGAANNVTEVINTGFAGTPHYYDTTVQVAAQ